MHFLTNYQAQEMDRFQKSLENSSKRESTNFTFVPKLYFLIQYYRIKDTIVSLKTTQLISSVFVTKSGGLSCDGTHAPPRSAKVPADEPAVFVDLAFDNRFEPVEMPTVSPLYHGLSVSFPAFRIACCQKHADVEGLYGTVHRRGGDTPEVHHPSPVATSSPLEEKGHCSAAVGDGVGGEMASKCLLLMMLSWPTTGVGKNLLLTKDSEKIRTKNDQASETSTLKGSGSLYSACHSNLV